MQMLQTATLYVWDRIDKCYTTQIQMLQKVAKYAGYQNYAWHLNYNCYGIANTNERDRIHEWSRQL